MNENESETKILALEKRLIILYKLMAKMKGNLAAYKEIMDDNIEDLNTLKNLLKNNYDDIFSLKTILRNKDKENGKENE